MAESMTFLPRAAVMSMEEAATIAGGFIDRGVRKIRLTGGEPLVRRGIEHLARDLGKRLTAGGGLRELTLTTNGTLLDVHAPMLADAGVRRINVSLDSLDADRFRHITRRGDLNRTLGGIRAATQAGLRVKINMVALKGLNDDDIIPMMHWCAGEGHDLTLIETMPMGMIDEDRTDRYLPLSVVKVRIEQDYSLAAMDETSGGPARYWRVGELGLKLGLITPLTNNFCDGCNRVRLSATGKLYLCLGHDDKVDLLKALREGGENAMHRAMDDALRIKPLRHHFEQDMAAGTASVDRHMSVTGG
jgi:cyclic pyranopterin phosphate synthase